MIELWNRWDGDGRTLADARGHDIALAKPTERAAWTEALAPVTDRYLNEISSQFLSARALYAEMRAMVSPAGPES